MLFDLHIHQSLHSSDSRLLLEQAVIDAKEAGLDGICITDHDDLGLRPLAEKLSEQYDLKIFVGVEIYTLDGDILCYGIDEMPAERLSAQETIEYVHQRDGVCIAAHPYRHNNRGVKDLIRTLNLDAIEVYNGRTDSASNEKALLVAENLNIPMTASSDAHTPGEVGKFVTSFDYDINTESDFLNAIRNGHMKPYEYKRQRTA